MALNFFGILLALVSVFLMLLILVQRGKGGGLTGALGGMGGQSAFGAKAGDAFTKITTITSIIWITLCMLTIALFNPPPRADLVETPEPTLSGAPAEPEGAGARPAATEKTGDAAAKPASENAADSEDYEIDLSPDDGTGNDNPTNTGDENSIGDGNSDNDSPGDG